MTIDDIRIQEDLSGADIQRFRAATTVGVDLELTGLIPHRDRICLIQVSDGFRSPVLLKRTDWRKATRLRELLLDKGVTKVFHYALVDCAFLYRHLDFMVENIYCTKIASRLARTYTDRHGLSALAGELLHIRLDKLQQSSDWCKDDLSEEQIEYAASDVFWLPELKQRLDYMLAARGALSSTTTYVELNNDCQRFIPTLVQLWLNGWDCGFDDGKSVFSH